MTKIKNLEFAILKKYSHKDTKAQRTTIYLVLYSIIYSSIIPLLFAPTILPTTRS